MPNKSIDSNSYIPYYHQLYLLLKERILAKEWKPGQKFFSEGDLCQEYGISRTVVRNALQELESDGLISRRKGKGTFVLGSKISEGLAQNLAGFYQDMTEKGLQTTSRILIHQVIPCPDKVCGFLNVPPQSPVIQLYRLRYVEGDPIALVTSYLPLQICPALENEDLTDRSLYEYLENQCGITIARAQRILEATIADESQSKLLEIAYKDPVIKLESISFSEEGIPVEYFIAFHRGDRARFEINLLRVRDKWRLMGGEHPDNLLIKC
jgi:GntR family transcriptional regulator